MQEELSGQRERGLLTIGPLSWPHHGSDVCHELCHSLSLEHSGSWETVGFCAHLQMANNLSLPHRYMGMVAQRTILPFQKPPSEEA